MEYKRKEIIGDCTLYLGDCMKVMPTLGKVDAVVSVDNNLSNVVVSDYEQTASRKYKKSRGS